MGQESQDSQGNHEILAFIMISLEILAFLAKKVTWILGVVAFCPGGSMRPPYLFDPTPPLVPNFWIRLCLLNNSKRCCLILKHIYAKQ